MKIMGKDLDVEMTVMHYLVPHLSKETNTILSSKIQSPIQFQTPALIKQVGGFCFPAVIRFCLLWLCGDFLQRAIGQVVLIRSTLG